MMNKITGKITLDTTNQGIPNLLVVIYDIDPDTKPEELIQGLPENPNDTQNKSTARIEETRSSKTLPKNELGYLGDRIGSVLTGQDGSFSFEYEDAEFQIRSSVEKEKRPDLFLMVFAPEKMGGTLEEALLFYSLEIRQNAGRMESFFIQISEDKLKQLGLQTVFDTGNANIKSNFSSIQVLREQSKSIAAELLKGEKVSQDNVRKLVNEKAWTSLFKLDKKPDMKRATVEEIKKESKVNISKINKEVFDDNNAKGKTVYVYIPKNEKEAFLAADATKKSEMIEKYIVKFDEISKEGAIFQKEFTNPLSNKEKDDLIEEMQKGVTKTSKKKKENKDSESDAIDNFGDYVKRLIDPMKSPEELLKGIYNNQHTLDENTRPDGDTVNQNIKDLEFKGGPADVPAFYDFHSLQIAFPYVWQDLIDNDVIQITEDLLTQLTESGVDIGDITDDDLIEKVTEIVRHVENVEKINKKYSQPIVKNGAVEVEKEASFRLQANPTTESGWLLKSLTDLLNEQSKFTVFKEGLINYGIMVTYRQKWTPLNYQVGDLVRSIPLAPKEVRKVSVKKVIKKDNIRKSMESNLRSSQNESNETSRTEKEIVDKAQRNNSFGLNATASGGYNAAVWNVQGSVTTDIKNDASNSSDAIKKDFREAVKKATQEFKDERKTEIETKETFESEYTESSEISNPNDELTVTYLFYELQRRFEVSEKLHKVTPVVLIPMKMPMPDQKDMNGLILKYGWVINRILLDDRFRPALEYIMAGLLGEEAAIKQLELNITSIYANINNFNTLIVQTQNRINRLWDEYHNVQNGLNASDGDGPNAPKHRASIETIRQLIQEATQLQQKYLEQIGTEKNNLLSVIEELNRLKTAFESKLFEINMLRLHIKENIFYYMQNIWHYTYKDNFFMTFYNLQVPVISSKQKTYSVVTVHANDSTDLPPSVTQSPDKVIVEVEVKYEMEIPQNSEMQTLIEIADLDNPLGYKGNYMIFPMKRPNAITEYMMTPFLDEELGLRDPDGWGQWTPDEFVEFFHYLKQTKSEKEFEEIEKALVAQYGRILDASRRLTEEIVVPSDSLYIEALPGKHPLLEDFKLKHRIMDVQKVQAEVRKVELENLRYANRILDKQLDDPDTEKKIIVEKGINSVIDTEG